MMLVWSTEEGDGLFRCSHANSCSMCIGTNAVFNRSVSASFVCSGKSCSLQPVEPSSIMGSSLSPNHYFTMRWFNIGQRRQFYLMASKVSSVFPLLSNSVLATCLSQEILTRDVEGGVSWPPKL
ncbi:unnamed protein product [Soboliphyme baturini]|uniref:Ig-like domain-containing protein n=1 Tax=Soboliphyme baturini TaxID=241478 RepID=A0A183IFA4_9BILA|nr:unnamed protein product [Soboliphyme baturini]